ncbi:MAG TPA: CBS domain-containing protein [Rhizomicrobium sp.]|nr:CBS domain-containing protein [Rhizomicrobium sp.]
MSCIAIMNKAPVTIQEHESVAAAAAKLLSNHFISLPVVDAQDRYVGTFGLHDLLSLLVPRVALAGDLISNLRFIADDPEELRSRYRDVRNQRVDEVVNRNAPTLDPDSSEVEAIRLFCRNHMSLPVVSKDSGHVMGVVSCWDAMRAIVGAG